MFITDIKFEYFFVTYDKQKCWGLDKLQDKFDVKISAIIMSAMTSIPKEYILWLQYDFKYENMHLISKGKKEMYLSNLFEFVIELIGFWTDGLTLLVYGRISWMVWMLIFLLVTANDRVGLYMWVVMATVGMER